MAFVRVVPFPHIDALLWDLEHADDTVLLWNSSFQVEGLLRLVQREGAWRGLYLNYGTYDHFRLDSAKRIFLDPLLLV